MFWFSSHKGDGKNQQCLLSYRDEHGTLLRPQTQPTIHSGQPVIEGGSTLVDRSTESESKSLESHRHSADFPPTFPSPTTSPTMRRRRLPHRAGASAPYITESSNSEDKPGTTKPTATQHGKLTQVEPENGVTVIFHVMLASDLNMEEEHMHIQAEGEDLGDFKTTCVDMKLVRLVCFCKKLHEFCELEISQVNLHEIYVLWQVNTDVKETCKLSNELLPQCPLI